MKTPPPRDAEVSSEDLAPHFERFGINPRSAGAMELLARRLARELASQRDEPQPSSKRGRPRGNANRDRDMYDEYVAGIRAGKTGGQSRLPLQKKYRLSEQGIKEACKREENRRFALFREEFDALLLAIKDDPVEIDRLMLRAILGVAEIAKSNPKHFERQLSSPNPPINGKQLVALISAIRFLTGEEEQNY